MVYRFKENSFIKADAQIAGKVCEELEADNNLTAKALVDVSRPEDAPLHNEFEWDDSLAAELYRESQARHIIACLEVVTESCEPMRAFFNIVRSEPQYKHIEAIMKSSEDKEMLFRTALSELRAFQKKYNDLKQFAEVFEAIDRLGKTA